VRLLHGAVGVHEGHLDNRRHLDGDCVGGPCLIEQRPTSLAVSDILLASATTRSIFVGCNCQVLGPHQVEIVCLGMHAHADDFAVAKPSDKSNTVPTHGLLSFAGGEALLRKHAGMPSSGGGASSGRGF